MVVGRWLSDSSVVRVSVVTDGKVQQGNRRPDDEGRNGGATMKAAAARRGRQRRRNDEGRTLAGNVVFSDVVRSWF